MEVVGGRSPACRLVILACERHLRDLKEGPARGLIWRPQSALYAIEFFGYLRHSKGEWGGKPIVLEPWQEFGVGSVFGWMRADGLRRFRTVYEELPRKNGKSTKLAGVGIYVLVADHEPGAEVYAAAPLALDTLIPTADGWKTMGDLRIGDVAFSESGDPCNVTYVSPVLHDRECYELEFTDGTTVVCDAEHRWLTDATQIRDPIGGSRSMPKLRQTGDGKAQFSLHNRRHYVCPWGDLLREERFDRAVAQALAERPLVRGRLGVRTTAEIVASLLTSQGNPNHRVPAPGSLDCPVATLPIPPYTLGAWLGDGRSNRGSIVCHPSDDMGAQIERDGFALSEHGNEKLRAFTVLGLRTLLRQSGLLDRKHIPSIYFRASPAQRLRLLQGLMDTDGTCTKTGECRFTNRNIALAEGVCELARGLGLRTRVRGIIVTGKPHYMVSFKASAEMPVFLLPRKAARTLPERSETLKWRYIKAARSVPSVPVRCISVDSPSHLYLATKGLVATHNTKRDQARIIFGEAQRMVRASPELRELVGVFKLNLSIDRTNSKFEPLSSDERTLDGLNPHCVLVDELHKHRSRALLDVMDTALGSRRQPLLWAITTAGDDNPESVYAQENDYAIKVLENVVQDDTHFAFISTIDKADRWDDPKAWARANPNLGVSVKLDDLQRQAAKAKNSPPSLAAFLRLRLNVRTASADRAIDMEVWARNSAGPFDPASLHGRRFYAGLDLSSKTDLTAWVKLFPPIDDDPDVWRVVARFWMPGDTVEEKSDRDRVQYRRWIDAGLIEATPGNIIDHSEIEAAVLEDCRLSICNSIAFDPWNAAQLSVRLQGEGAPMFEFIQGIRSYNAPTKELDALLQQGKLEHGGNEVLAWMAHNLAISRPDRNENVMPSKKHSTGRIDGMSALIMAIGRSMADIDSDGLDRFLSGPLAV